MERHQGGVEPRVAEGALDETEVHAGFESMGSVRMSEGMDGDAQFGKTSPACGCAEGPLAAVAAHGKSGGRTLLVIPPGGGKEPGGVTMGCPGGS